MAIDEEDINITVLGIFFDLNVPPNGRLTYKTLQEQWPQYQLRGTDLDLGLNQLEARGDLHRIEEDGIDLVILTPKGRQYGRSLGSTAHIAQSIWTRFKEAVWPEPLPPILARAHRPQQHRINNRTRASDGK